MRKSIFEAGDLLDAVFCPEQGDGSCAGGAVGISCVTQIEVAQACGPMDFYDVAKITRSDTEEIEIIPLHMAEYIRYTPTAARSDKEGE